jgi:hypothetical protein
MLSSAYLAGRLDFFPCSDFTLARRSLPLAIATARPVVKATEEQLPAWGAERCKFLGLPALATGKGLGLAQD